MNRSQQQRSLDTSTVETRGLTKSYGQLLALSPLSLTVLPGERVAMAGPSGSGKTTLLYLLAGLIQPDGGELSVLGRDMARIRPGRELSEMVGIIHQQFNLVPHLPVVHNVLAGRLGQWGILRALLSLVSPQDRELAWKALKQLGVDEKINERTLRLSGGEQQRVAIARLMVQNPRILLADEPVSSLDPARANEILQLLTGLAGDSGKTLLASLHAPELIRKYFTRVIGLRAGVLQFDLPVERLDGPVLEALYDLDGDGSDRVESPVF